MDASKLTRLRREAANNWIHTTDTVDASETTRKRKLQASQFFNCNINANPTICYVLSAMEAMQFLIRHP